MVERLQLTRTVFKQELNAFRGKCSMLFHYDMISVPLVYTQVSAAGIDSELRFL